MINTFTFKFQLLSLVPDADAKWPTKQGTNHIKVFSRRIMHGGLNYAWRAGLKGLSKIVNLKLLPKRGGLEATARALHWCDARFEPRLWQTFQISIKISNA